MRAVRGLLVALGVGCGLWGVWLMRDFTREQLTSEAFWLAGGVVLHDAVLAPVVVGIGYAASRVLPAHWRSATATAFVVWGTLTVAFLPVLSGQGGKPGNDTILGKPYVLSWVVLTLVLAAYAGVAALLRRRQARSSDMKTLHGSGS
ncbi:hypothetical protein [Aeromicrobium endophyticum]|uniref:Uncharacterized protein n=1 Tax=Aeromicrobium endophyticum TaxID=2292704 RepID=A0A371PBM1_9ACTN|nr:hypothetical protein [Aeromicrobium endophyticum]REK73331.1 hypothetical protein DX116_07180 [Aeromicrobium endophyticum]